MEQLRGIMTALMELIQKLAGDNESLTKLFDTVTEILEKINLTT